MKSKIWKLFANNFLNAKPVHEDGSQKHIPCLCQYQHQLGTRALGLQQPEGQLGGHGGLPAGGAGGEGALQPSVQMLGEGHTEKDGCQDTHG